MHLKLNQKDANIKIYNNKAYHFLHFPLFLDISGLIVDNKVKIKISGLLKHMLLKSKRFVAILEYLEEQKPAFIGEKLVFSIYLPEIPSKAFNRLLINDFFKRTLNFNSAPDAATLAITQQCPAHCKHCSAHRRKNQIENELTTKEWIDVIKQLYTLGCFNFTFTGGEPLLRKDLNELIKTAKKEKSMTQLFTSGYYLDIQTAKKLKQNGLNSIHISIDSILSEKHDEIRGLKGLHNRSIKAVKNSVESQILTGLVFITTPDSIKTGEIKQIMNLAKKLRVHNVTFADPIPAGKWINKESMLIENNREFMEKFHLEINSNGSYPRIETMAYVNGPRGGGCFGGFNQINITPTGDVTTCDMTPLSFGNVREEKIKDIWKKMRKHNEYKIDAR